LLGALYLEDLSINLNRDQRNNRGNDVVEMMENNGGNKTNKIIKEK
jgi:hypothetical protein